MNERFDLKHRKRLESEINNLRSAILELKQYFCSGNEIPVDRATIKASDFFRIIRGLGL